MSDELVRQTVIEEAPAGRLVCMDSAYDVAACNRGRDVVITGSYSGVLCARFVSTHRPRGVLGVDCGLGLEGAGIAGLWYYEALNIPAAAVAVMDVELGNGVDVFERGIVSRLNDPAARCGVTAGMTAAAAGRLMLDNGLSLQPLAPVAVTHRTVVRQLVDRDVVCIDSIAFGLPEDRERNVLCTAGHTGRSAAPYLRRIRPHAFICSDGGGGRDRSGTAGLFMVEEDGIAGAVVDARTARMGDGLSTYFDGVISAANSLAIARGVAVGMTARVAAEQLIAE